MSNPKLMTAAALGFAAFSLWYITSRNKTATAPNVGATNYTPALDALVNRNPVTDPAPVQIKVSELAYWHEGYGGALFKPEKNPFALGF